MAAREDGLSSRCISLLEEVRGLIENQGSSVNVGQNEPRATHTQNPIGQNGRPTATHGQNPRGSRLGTPNERGHGSTSTPSEPRPEHRPERVMENFRSLFSPCGGSKNNLSRPPPAKKAKKGPFQVKETWTHEFFCLASTTVTRVPSRMEKLKLQDAGLGRRKIVFSCKASAFEVQSVLENIYPKLSETGGFELLRSGSPCTSLITIHPPATGGYSVPFLRDSAGLGQALAYIRPLLQKDLNTAAVVIAEQVCEFPKSACIAA